MLPSNNFLALGGEEPSYNSGKAGIDCLNLVNCMHYLIYLRKFFFSSSSLYLYHFWNLIIFVRVNIYIDQTVAFYGVASQFYDYHIFCL